MAYTQSQLEAQLKNAQKYSGSTTGQATINRITSQLNALKPTTPATPTVAKTTTTMPNTSVINNVAKVANSASKSPSASNVPSSGNNYLSAVGPANITKPTAITVSTMPKPTYDFTQTPAQNASVGNDAGYSGVVSATKVPAQPVAQPTGQLDVSSILSQLTNAMKSFVDASKANQQPYQSPYAVDMQNTLAAINKWKPTAYDPNSDSGLKEAQKQAMLQAQNEAVRKGRVFDTWATTQEQQAAQRLIPQYQQIHEQNQQQNFGNMVNKLGALSGMDATQYGRYRDTVSDVNTANMNQYNMSKDLYNMAQKDIESSTTSQNTADKARIEAMKDLGYTELDGKIVPTLEREKFTATQLKDVEAQEKNKFGMVLNDTARKYYGTYEDLYNNDVGFRNDIESNYGNLALLRDKYMANGDTEAADAVQGARLQKIINDPILLEQYGYEFGLSNTETKKKATELRTAQLEQTSKQMELAMKSLDYSNYEKETQLKLEKAEEDLISKKYDNFIKNIEASFIEPKLKQDLINAGLQAQNIQNQINSRNITTEIAMDKAKEEKAPTESEIKYAYNQDYMNIKGKSFDDAYGYLMQHKNQIAGNYGLDGYKKMFNQVMEDAINQKYKIDGKVITAYDMSEE
jgi:hypothetical protein